MVNTRNYHQAAMNCQNRLQATSISTILLPPFQIKADHSHDCIKIRLRTSLLLHHITMHCRHCEIGFPHLFREPINLWSTQYSTIVTTLLYIYASAPSLAHEWPNLFQGISHAKAIHTFRLVLQKMTAWVIVNVSYRSQSVSNFHSSFSTAAGDIG